jgi:hypothetical protein
MSEDRKYVRIYYSINDDPKFDTIRNHEVRFYTWVRLLMAADAVWPSSADLPRWVKRLPLLALVDAGLVELLPGERFRIKGMNDERGRRAEAARVGGLASGRSRSVERPLNDRSDTSGTESNLAKQSRAEQSQAKPSNGRADAMDTYWTLMGKYPNGRTKEWLEELVNEFDDYRVSAALAAESKGDRQGFLSRVRDRLRSEADKAAKAKAAAETERLEAEAAAKRITPEQAQENQRRVRDELAKMIGAPK